MIPSPGNRGRGGGSSSGSRHQRQSGGTQQSSNKGQRAYRSTKGNEATTSNPLHKPAAFLTKEELEALLQQKRSQEATTSASNVPHTPYKDVVQAPLQWLEKSHQDLVCLLPEGLNLQQPAWLLAHQALGGYHLFPQKAYKPIGYYRQLLLTMDIRIHQQKQGHGEIARTQVFIDKILSHYQWPGSPHHPYVIQNQSYTYFDYIDAFHYAFLSDNTDRNHTFYIQPSSTLLANPLPTWFYHWWTTFGGSIDIYKEMETADSLVSLFTEWSQVHPTFSTAQPTDLYSGQLEATFFLQYELPWIFRPQWKTHPTQGNIPALWRTYEVQRWRNFHTTTKFGNAIDAIKADLAAWHKLKPSPKFDFVIPPNATISELKAFYQRKYPQASEEEVMTFCIDQMQWNVSQQLQQHFKTSAQLDLTVAMSTGTSDLGNDDEEEGATTRLADSDPYADPYNANADG